MIWILGGTSEAREIVSRIKKYTDDFLVTVATEEGREFLDTKNLLSGRLSFKEMEDLVDDRDISMIVDLTHPYAEIVSRNAKELASKKEISYIRYVRPKIDEREDIIYLNSYEEAYEYLSNIEGTVFFTTGSKNIEDFEKVRGDNRFIYRILPALPSIELAAKSKVKMKDIVALLGPFTKDFNKAILDNYRADFCVTKDSGAKGGTMDKIQACRELGIRTILIGRNMEDGYTDLEEIEKIIEKEVRSD